MEPIPKVENTAREVLSLQDSNDIRKNEWITRSIAGGNISNTENRNQGGTKTQAHI